MAKANPASTLRANREAANRLAEGAGVSKTRKLLKRAQRDLERRLRESEGLANADGSEAFTITQMRVTLAQVKHVMRGLKPDLRDAVVDQAGVAAGESAASTLRYLNRAERAYSGVNQKLQLDEARLLDNAVARTESSVLRRVLSDPDHPGQPGVIDRYGERVVSRFEEALQLRYVARQPWEDVKQSLTAESEFLQGAPSYWAERIVRTEVMHANNRASLETIRGADDELGDMLKILSCVFDGRTGADSYAVHGQIRRPDEAFQSWFGDFQHPPDRPNDRAVVVPHRMSWPLPGALAPRGEGEIASAWAREGRKGSPPGRPLMSTVPLAKIGAG